MWHTDVGGAATGGQHPSAGPGAGLLVGTSGEPGAGARDLVTVPARVGLEAVDILRLRAAAGPVLHDRSGDTLGFLVPPGTCGEWEMPGSVCAPTCPPPGGSWRHSGGPDGRPGGASCADGCLLVNRYAGGRASPRGAQVSGAECCEQPPVAGTRWLIPPASTPLRATHSRLLRAALAEAARTVRAAREIFARGGW